MEMKVVLAGAGAFGLKHLDAIKLIDGIEVVSVVGRRIEPTREAAAKYGVEARDDRAVRGARPARRGRRHPLHADADARRAGDRMHEGRQACAGRNPAGGFVGGCARP